MSDNKKYYYMRIKENFFESDGILILESMQDGYVYSNILLKLYLKSLKSNGRLMFNDRIPYNAQMIATITRQQVGTVEKALQIFQEMNLIEILNNGAIYMNDIQNFIGTSSSEADRIREYDRKKKEEKLAIENTECRNLVENYTKDRDRDRVIDKDIKDIVVLKNDTLSKIDEVINYLNEKTGKSFRSNTKKNFSLINARLRDKYTFEDFKKVIDTKCEEWLNDPKWSKYLQPSTLFCASNFESYLNQWQPDIKNQKSSFVDNKKIVVDEVIEDVNF